MLSTVKRSKLNKEFVKTPDNILKPTLLPNSLQNPNRTICVFQMTPMVGTTSW